MTPSDRPPGRPAFTALVVWSSGLCVALAIAGLILAQRYGFPARIAVPVVAAFCWISVLYCIAVSRSGRARVLEVLPPRRLACVVIPAVLAPYAIYAIPAGVFSITGLLRLLALSVAVVVPYLLFPARGRRFAPQDLVVCIALAYPMVSGLSTMFRDVFVGFEPPAHRLDSLGKLMLIPLGLAVFVGLRRLEGARLRLWPDRMDVKAGFDSATVGLPFVLAVGLLTGYLVWDPPLENTLAAIGGALAKVLGIYLTTALAEEFLMRGVLQNLLTGSTGRPLVSQAIAALLFGAVHLGRGAFPNLPHAASAATLGWFCGRAYAKSGSVTAAMITHALAIGGQELFFR